MRSIRYLLIGVMVAALGASGFFLEASQGQGQSESLRIWALKGDGEVQVLPTPIPLPPEITVDLPGGVTMEMICIPAGSFMMGRYPGEQASYGVEDPQHSVTIGSDFFMGKCVVTQGQWFAVMGSNPAQDYGVGDNYPVYNISWNDCQDFVAALNQLGQGAFRLPSEAEWEYACRADTTTRFYFGDSDGCGTHCKECPAGTLPGNQSDYMWYCGNNTPYGTKPGGSKLPNAFGLFDMHGNLWEWCQDYWHSSYHGAPDNGGAWESPTSEYRVLRGGTWLHFALYCRSAYRGRNRPVYASHFIGFRLVREAE